LKQYKTAQHWNHNIGNSVHQRQCQPGPFYPMGPLGPGPGPPRLRGPPNSPCIIFISWNNRN